MKKKILFSIGGVVVVALLAFAYYAISPLFRNIKADDAVPVAATPQGASAQVIGTTGHPASGTVRIVRTSSKATVRYENFKTINGPDIYVYLAKDTEAKNFVSLGKVRATEGNINYDVPEGVDISQYRYVLTWCKTFGVLFNSADLNTSLVSLEQTPISHKIL